MPTTARTAAPASPRAAAYWVDLRTQMVDLMVELGRLTTGEEAAAEAEAKRAEMTDAEGLTAAAARTQIDAMLSTVAYLRRTVREARRTAPAAVVEAAAPADELLEDRFYLLDGVAYRTKRARAGHLYAVVWNADERGWDLARGVIRRLTSEHRLSVEQAEAMSLHLGECIRCHAELTDPKSVARGMGPVCVKKV